MTTMGRDGRSAMLAEPTLSVEFRSVGPICVLTLVGELGERSVAALDAQIDQLGCSRFVEVVLDVTGLRSIDDVGVRVLVGLYHYVMGRLARLRVVGPRPAIVRALRETPLLVQDTDPAMGTPLAAEARLG
jgi:anti-anti-sigma factor